MEATHCNLLIGVFEKKKRSIFKILGRTICVVVLTYSSCEEKHMNIVTIIQHHLSSKKLQKLFPVNVCTFLLIYLLKTRSKSYSPQGYYTSSKSI